MNSGTPAICLTVRRWVGIVPGFAVKRISSERLRRACRAGVQPARLAPTITAS